MLQEIFNLGRNNTTANTNLAVAEEKGEIKKPPLRGGFLRSITLQTSTFQNLPG